MRTVTDGETPVAGTVGRGAVVLGVVTVQAVAFWAAAELLSAPTLYVAVALGSAAALVAAGGGGWRGVAAAAVGTAVVAAVAAAFGQLFMAALGPVVLTALVGVTEGRWTDAAAATLGTLLLVVIGVPLGLFVLRQDPAVVAEKAASPAVQQMLALTVVGPLLATLVSLAFGVPLAYLLAAGFTGQSLVESLVDLPLVVPHSVAGLLILFGFGRGAAFDELRVLGTLTGMVLALTFVSAPFAVNAAREGFETVNPRLTFAARAHGASQFEAFRRVTLPLAARGILTGGLLAWARAVSEFGAVAIVAYSVEYFSPLSFEEVTTQHAPVFIFNTYTTEGLVESGAVATILLAMSAVIFLLVRWVAYDDAGGSIV